MILSSQRTVYGAAIQLAQLLNKEYTPLSNTTLNEKFNIEPNYEADDKLYPTLQYYAIGIGGNPAIEDGVGYTYNQHSPVDAALFNHIPFIMRPVVADLDEEERAMYRFRKIEIHNTVEYACYYLKVIDTIELRDFFYKITTKDSLSSLTIFSTDTDKLLNPVPKDRNIDASDISNYVYVAKMSKLKFELSIAEMLEIKNVLEIRNLADKHITEIGVCTGIDVDYEDAKESMITQIAFHVGVNLNLTLALNNDASILRSIEIGGTEPLRI